jgi:hypothetical protein
MGKHPALTEYLFMEEVTRIVDGDLELLEQRVERALEDGAECVVARFTYWYTSRPPVHEAVVMRPERAV